MSLWFLCLLLDFFSSVFIVQIWWESFCFYHIIHHFFILTMNEWMNKHGNLANRIKVNNCYLYLLGEGKWVFSNRMTLGILITLGITSISGVFEKHVIGFNTFCVHIFFLVIIGLGAFFPFWMWCYFVFVCFVGFCCCLPFLLDF